MDRLTPRARALLRDYLDDMRSLMTAGDLDAEEVEEDIRDHVLAATAEYQEPVDADVVAQVLRELGPPSRWLSRDDSPAPDPASEGKRRFDGLRMMAGAVFVATVVGLAVFPWVGPLALLVAWALARATMAHAREAGRSLGPLNKWLIYPPLVLVALAALALILVGPIRILMAVSLPLPRWATLAAGLAALVGRLFPSIPRLVLFPVFSPRSGDRP